MMGSRPCVLCQLGDLPVHGRAPGSKEGLNTSWCLIVNERRIVYCPQKGGASGVKGYKG